MIGRGLLALVVVGGLAGGARAEAPEPLDRSLGFAILAGSRTLPGDADRFTGGLRLDYGRRAGPLTLRAEAELLMVSASEPGDDARGRGHRFGLSARTPILGGRSERLRMGGSLWLEVGAGHAWISDSTLGQVGQLDVAFGAGAGYVLEGSDASPSHRFAADLSVRGLVSTSGPGLLISVAMAWGD